ncbi:MAG: hypothetical protein QNJ12_06180 [Ilumatobacter sp.]|uniref:hypothetical protein n=1 Tax=Ilumatobacter sp. TaxID=1967498 RepID=UPI002620AEFB|nr:hypothetical protein [Ilumatobacter sp.]MDJ0768360.1 hypothetical protein [Ilumatobacter sp.]
MRRLRVLYAPRNIAGQAEAYAHCLRAAGHSAEVWSYGPPAFSFGADRVIDLGRLRADPLHRWQVLDDAVRSFDVIHFQYGRSLVDPDLPEVAPLSDLPLLWSLDKKLIMNYRGSDVRLKSVHTAREPDSYMRSADVECDEARIRANVSVARRYCDALLVSTPGLLDYVPDAMWLPHVVDTQWWAKRPAAERTIPRVAHMPSRRSAKASDVVDRTCRTLSDRGVIEYVPLTGLDRDGVRAAFHAADIVVDSLTIGDHGLVSVEAMAAGAIAVAHIHERNRDRNPGVPVVEATVHDLELVLEGLAADPDRRAALKRESVDWVRAKHSMEVVGPLLVDLYQRPHRASGLSDPSFPAVGDDRRIRTLEAEIERLRSVVAPGVVQLERRSSAERIRDEIALEVVPRARRIFYRSGAARVVRGVRRRVRRGIGR